MACNVQQVRFSTERKLGLSDISSVSTKGKPLKRQSYVIHKGGVRSSLGIGAIGIRLKVANNKPRVVSSLRYSVF